MLCFSNHIAVIYVSLFVSDRQELITKKWSFLDLSKIFYFWSAVTMIDQLIWFHFRRGLVHLLTIVDV